MRGLLAALFLLAAGPSAYADGPPDAAFERPSQAQQSETSRNQIVVPGTPVPARREPVLSCPPHPGPDTATIPAILIVLLALSLLGNAFFIIRQPWMSRAQGGKEGET